MKIVFTTHTYWPSKDGVQYVTQYLAEGLAEKGHEVVVFAPQNTAKKIDREYHNKVTVIRPYFKQKLSFVVGDKSFYKKSFLEECNNADCIINCAVQSPFNNFALSLLHKVKAKKILYLHGVYDYKYSMNLRPKEVIKKFLLNVRWYVFYHLNASKFNLYDLMVNITNDELNTKFFGKLGVHVPTVIINNAVENFDNIYLQKEDVQKFPVLQKKYFLDVANYNERKNQLMLIQAFAKYQREQNSDIELVMVGKESGYSDECEAFISTLECKDKIHLYKSLSRKDTRNLIKNCYCAVMSSTFEVYPIFLSEALMCGHPFISTNVGSVEQMEGGIVVQDTPEFVNALINISNDVDLYKKLSIEGKNYANKNFCQSEKINELETLILSLTE